MSKKSYVLALALLLAALALAACGGSGGSGDSAAATESGAAENVPASDAEAAGAEDAGAAQGEGANTSNDNSGAGDTSGGNAAGDAGAATDVGSGSDGAQGSGGSDGASGATSPESDTGAPAQGDDTGNTESGTGGAADASGNTGSASGDAGNEAGTDAGSVAEGGTEAGAATGTGDNNAQPATGAAAYTAVSDAECTEIQGQLNTALGLPVERGTDVASFTDLSGNAGESCQLTVSGTGVEFPTLGEAAERVRQVFTDNGWTADAQYAADGPTGTIGGLRRDNQLAAYNVEWSPAAGVTCPADQPISACAETLTPEQMNYNITIDLAQQ